MRWLCFLLLANPYPLAAQASPKPLRFDLEGLTAKRDSFVFFLRGAERGYAVWQYEIRPLEMTQRILYTARSEFRPVEQESLRVVLNRLTGETVQHDPQALLLDRPELGARGVEDPGGDFERRDLALADCTGARGASREDHRRRARGLHGG